MSPLWASRTTAAVRSFRLNFCTSALRRSYLDGPGDLTNIPPGPGKHFEPLRILFCGADDFSAYSLRALHELKDKHPKCIESIDVVCRPDKRVGRGLKKVQSVPIKSVATSLRLPLHQLDTFKAGWTPPKPIDLIVAVSFGLLIPARLIEGAKYGGLNVHPSYLPDLPGPAPIQRALLANLPTTGITLQTLHPTRFDRGTVVANDVFYIPEKATVERMVELLGSAGAQLLANAVSEGWFVPPLHDVPAAMKVKHEAENGRPWREDAARNQDLRLQHASKITPEDRRIDWGTWTAEEIMRRDRVLGRLWYEAVFVQEDGKRRTKRVVYDGPWTEIDGRPQYVLSIRRPGEFDEMQDEEEVQLPLATVDGKVLIPTAVTVEGGRKHRDLLDKFEKGDRLRNDRTAAPSIS